MNMTMGIWLALIIPWVVLIVLFLLYSKEYIKKITAKSRRLEKKFILKNDENANTETQNRIKKIEVRLRRLENHLKEHQGEFNICHENVDTEYGYNAVEFSNQTGVGIKFFRSKQGKTLMEEADSKSAIFKVFNITGNEAEFEYCGGVQNPDFFTEICSFENNPADVPNKTKIITSMQGVVRKDSNNNWEVITPAKIKFE